MGNCEAMGGGVQVPVGRLGYRSPTRKWNSVQNTGSSSVRPSLLRCVSSWTKSEWCLCRPAPATGQLGVHETLVAM